MGGMELLAGPTHGNGHLFAGFSFTFESIPPERVDELTHSITTHGGDVSGMLTFAVRSAIAHYCEKERREVEGVVCMCVCALV